MVKKVSKTFSNARHFAIEAYITMQTIFEFSLIAGIIEFTSLEVNVKTVLHYYANLFGLTVSATFVVSEQRPLTILRASISDS